MTIHFLRKTRNPAEIPWVDLDVRLVVDTTGKFLFGKLSACRI